MSIPTFKVVVAGDGGVGKTSLLHRLLTGNVVTTYNATLGVEVHPYTFNVNGRTIRFNLWDTAGQEKFGGLRDGYYIEADAAIVMYDLGRNITARNVATWHRDLLRVAAGIPTLFLGNKSDVAGRARKKPDAASGCGREPLRRTCSVKTGEGVEGALEALGALLLQA